MAVETTLMAGLAGAWLVQRALYLPAAARVWRDWEAHRRMVALALQMAAARAMGRSGLEERAVWTVEGEEATTVAEAAAMAAVAAVSQFRLEQTLQIIKAILVAAVMAECLFPQ